MRLPSFRFTNRFIARDSWRPEAQDYMKHAPDEIITDFRAHLPQGQGKVLLDNVTLVNPLLGSPGFNQLRSLYENQLTWLAHTWAALCARSFNLSQNDLSVSALLIEGEFISCVITRDGKIQWTSSN